MASDFLQRKYQELLSQRDEIDRILEVLGKVISENSSAPISEVSKVVEEKRPEDTKRDEQVKEVLEEPLSGESASPVKPTLGSRRSFSRDLLKEWILDQPVDQEITPFDAAQFFGLSVQRVQRFWAELRRDNYITVKLTKEHETKWYRNPTKVK